MKRVSKKIREKSWIKMDDGKERDEEGMKIGQNEA